jgi:hypothetical protein
MGHRHARESMTKGGMGERKGEGEGNGWRRQNDLEALNVRLGVR